MPTVGVAEVLPADTPVTYPRPAVKGDEVLDVLPADGVPVLEEVKAPRPGRRETRRIIAVGTNGEVELLKNSVVIRRKGFLGFMTHGGAGDKEILLSFISGIEFQDIGVNVTGLQVFSGLVKNRPGYIRFICAGGQALNQVQLPVQGLGALFNVGQRSNALLKDENTVLFGHNSRDDFLALKEAVEERINEIHSR
jgi:hypothetical protein